MRGPMIDCSKITVPLIIHLFIAFLIFPSPQLVFGSDEQNTLSNDDSPFRISGDVYYGDKNRFNNPCVLKRDTVFKKIPAYQKIIREKLDKNSARYYLLLEEANRTFQNIVKTVASRLGYDLVAEKGCIKSSKRIRIKDITKEVVDAL